ncbi:MAG: recombinase family protein, partial [Negativibacillus sp.]
QLNALGSIPSKSKQWNANCVINVLQNVTYTGKIKWNWRKSVTTVEEGAIVKSRPKSEVHTLYEGKHDAIISDELFHAAQSRHGKIPKVKSNTKVRNPLAGLVYCHCGRAMALRVYKRGNIERSAPRLICQNQAICHTSSCTFDEMLERVRDVLLKNIENLEVQIQESDNQDSIQLHARLIKRLEAQLQELEKKEISQWEKYSEEAMPKHIFNSLNAKVLREKEEAQKALQQARLSMPNPTVYQEQLVCFRDALEALDDPQISAESKNKLLKACIKRIVYNRPPSVRVTKDMILDEHSQVNEKGWIAPPFELDITLRF